MHPRIAVASGKGGTGKTTFSVNLARSLPIDSIYIDADVEEPNGHIYLKPEILSIETVEVMLPIVDEQRCDHCGLCSKTCNFNALIVLKNSVIVFPELCHSCGACIIACPQNAIMEGTREIGVVREGASGRVHFIEGRLNEGEAKSPPLIKALGNRNLTANTCIIDVSPGTSCPVIEGVKMSDFVVLVTEPTPFGLHDLELAVGMVEILSLPYGVVINRCDIGNNCVEDYCLEKGIPILMRIPFKKEIATLSTRGEVFTDTLTEYRENFIQCYEEIKEIVIHVKEKDREQ